MYVQSLTPEGCFVFTFVVKSVNLLCSNWKSDFKRRGYEHDLITAVVWKLEVFGVRALRKSFTVKQETSCVQQLNMWKEHFLHIHILGIFNEGEGIGVVLVRRKLDMKWIMWCKCANSTSIDRWNLMLNYKSEPRLWTSNAGPLLTLVSGINPAIDGHQRWSLRWRSMRSYWVKEIIWH